MLEFQYAHNLLWLLIIPILFAVYFYSRKKNERILNSLGNRKFIDRQIFFSNPKISKRRFYVVLAALLLMIVGYANLRKPSGLALQKSKGVDVVIALDVSKSMLAKDSAPNRLTKAKLFIQLLMNKLKGNRVALIVFAGNAYVQVPLTSDFAAMQLALESVTPDLIPKQGTSLSQAIEISKESFSEKEFKYKSLIIISDGEDHDEEAVKAAKGAVETGVLIHTVGIGSVNGIQLINEDGTLKQDEEGQPVISKLNEQILKDIAQIGGGDYEYLDNINAVAKNLGNEINSMEQRDFGQMQFADYSNYFMYFIWLALALLVWHVIGFSKNRKVNNVA